MESRALGFVLLLLLPCWMTLDSFILPSGSSFFSGVKRAHTRVISRSPSSSNLPSFVLETQSVCLACLDKGLPQVPGDRPSAVL